MQTNSFHQAAERVRARFFRRFPHAHPTQLDLTTLKSRWYAKQSCERVRTRFGK